MFTRKTVFVVGAGASKEFGLPLGTEVADIIARKVSFRFNGGQLSAGDGNPELLNIIKNTAGKNPTFQKYLDACRQIASGLVLSNSIDRYLDFYGNDAQIQFCGKIALIQTILEAERGSSLYVNTSNMFNSLNFSRNKNTWLRRLISLLFGGITRSEVGHIYDNIAFITFNYDRCIEQYLFWALRAFGLPDQEAAVITSKLQIVHPYGVLGQLPFRRVAAGRPPPGGPRAEARASVRERRSRVGLQDGCVQAQKRSGVFALAERTP